MTTLISCPYLGTDVELTDEREAHIAERHGDLLPEFRFLLLQTVSDPDMVRVTRRLATARLFSRWFADLAGGKHIVAIVITDASKGRHWLVTAYISRKLVSGDIEWQRG